MNTLSEGVHNLKLQYGLEAAEAPFKVEKEKATEPPKKQEPTVDSLKQVGNKVPQTSDNTPTVLLFVAMMIGGAGVICYGRRTILRR